jgi:hypothetical protein
VLFRTFGPGVPTISCPGVSQDVVAMAGAPVRAMQPAMDPDPTRTARVFEIFMIDCSFRVCE